MLAKRWWFCGVGFFERALQAGFDLSVAEIEFPFKVISLWFKYLKDRIRPVNSISVSIFNYLYNHGMTFVIIYVFLNFRKYLHVLLFSDPLFN